MTNGTKSETVEMHTTERTWRINVEVLTDPAVTAHREILRYTNDLVVGKEQIGQTQRTVAQSAETPLAIPGTELTITLGQIVATLVAATDIWHAEDIASEEAQTEAMNKMQKEATK